MSQHRSVAVLGASSDRRKYGNKAVRAYLAAGWKVFSVTPGSATVEGLATYHTIDEINESLDAVTVYVPASVGVTCLARVAAKRPGEIWINPGAESAELRAKAAELRLPVVYGCSIVALGSRPSDFPDE